MFRRSKYETQVGCWCKCITNSNESVWIELVRDSTGEISVFGEGMDNLSLFRSWNQTPSGGSFRSPVPGGSILPCLLTPHPPRPSVEHIERKGLPP